MFTVYGRHNCPYCEKAIDLLEHQVYDYIDVLKTPEAVQFLKEKNLRTVPQIWFGDHYIGGYEDLTKYLASRLDQTPTS